MIRWRPFFGLALAALLTLTALATGLARGAMAADGVICGPGEVRLVLAADGLPLFSDGAPVEAAVPICPDCVIGAMAIAPAVAGPARPADLNTTLTPTLWHRPLSAEWRMGGSGRGPPCAA